MKQSFEKIIVESEQNDICVNTFTTLVPYFSEFDMKLILKMFTNYQHFSEMRKTYAPKNITEKRKRAIDLEEKYIVLMGEYISYKNGGPPLSEKEDEELLQVHTLFRPNYSQDALNNNRTNYRIQLKLIAELHEQIENGDVVFDSGSLKAIPFETTEAIRLLVGLLTHPNTITEKDYDAFDFVAKLPVLIETTPSMVEAVAKYKEAIGAKKKVYGLLYDKDPRKMEHLVEESLRLLERSIFDDTEKQEWREVIEKMEQRTMEDELQNILQLFRRMELELKESNEKIEKLEEALVAEAPKCRENIVDFGKVMRKNIEEKNIGSDQDAARELLARLKEIE